MPVVITTVNPGDTKDAGRIKWNNNDQDLADGVNALETQQEDHVTAGHPTLYYNKAAIDAQQSTQDDALTAHKGSGDHDARYLQIANLLAQLNALLAANIIEFPKGATQEGKFLATQEYVAKRLSSVQVNGYTITKQILMHADNTGALSLISDQGNGPAGINQIYIPDGAILRKIIFSFHDDEGGNYGYGIEDNIDAIFTAAVQTHVAFAIAAPLNAGEHYLSPFLQYYKPNTGTGILDLIATHVFSNDFLQSIAGQGMYMKHDTDYFFSIQLFITT